MMVCPVCGKYLFAEAGDYDICPVCNWENDPIQSDNPDFSGGSNVMSLNEARKAYRKASRRNAGVFQYLDRHVEILAVNGKFFHGRVIDIFTEEGGLILRCDTDNSLVEFSQKEILLIMPDKDGDPL